MILFILHQPGITNDTVGSLMIGTVDSNPNKDSMEINQEMMKDNQIKEEYKVVLAYHLRKNLMVMILIHMSQMIIKMKILINLQDLITHHQYQQFHQLHLRIQMCKQDRLKNHLDSPRAESIIKDLDQERNQVVSLDKQIDKIFNTDVGPRMKNNAIDKEEIMKIIAAVVGILHREIEAKMILLIEIDQKDLEVKKNTMERTGKTEIEEVADILNVPNHECTRGIYLESGCKQREGYIKWGVDI